MLPWFAGPIRLPCGDARRAQLPEHPRFPGQTCCNMARRCGCQGLPRSPPQKSKLCIVLVCQAEHMLLRDNDHRCIVWPGGRRRIPAWHTYRQKLHTLAMATTPYTLIQRNRKQKAWEAGPWCHALLVSLRGWLLERHSARMADRSAYA